MSGGLVEIGLGGDGDDSEPALLRIDRGIDAGGVAAAMAEGDDAVAGIERLMIEKLLGVASVLSSQSNSRTPPGPRTLCHITRGSVSGLKPT